MTEREADIIAMYDTGATITAVAAEFGVSKQRIYQVLKKHNIRTNPKNRPFNFRTRHLGVLITPKMFKALKKQAKQRRVSVSVVVADILDKGLSL